MKKEATIVLLHGWATDSSVWAGFLKNLPKGFNVINLDLPGHGDKTNGDKWGIPSFKPGTDFLLRSIKGRTHSPLIGIGWSLGAGVLMESAVQGRGPFDAIVLAGATPCFAKKPDFLSAQSAPLVRRMIMDMRKDPMAALRRFYRLNFTEAELLNPHARAFVKRFIGLSDSFRHDELANALQALYKTDLRGSLSMINAPTLVVHGSLDSVCPAGAGRFLADNIKNARFVEFKGSGHAFFITRPGDFAGAISEFIEGLDP